MASPPILRPILAEAGFFRLPAYVPTDLLAQCKRVADNAWQSPADDIAATWHDSVDQPHRRLPLKLAHFLHRDRGLLVALTERLAAVAEAAFGQPVRLFADEVLWRAPGTIGFGGHQPTVWLGWGLLVPNVVLTTIALDAASPATGAPELAAHVHAQGALDGFFHKRGCMDLDYVPLSLEAGDVLVHDGLAPLRLPAGSTRTNHALLTLAWNAAAAGDLRDRQHNFFPRLRRHFTYQALRRQFVTPAGPTANVV